MSRSKRTTNDRKLVLGFIVVVSIVAVAILYGLYTLLTALSPTVLRVWAVAATLALPLVGWVSWHVSRSITDTHLAGVDKGIDKVMHAAQKTADVRDRSAAMSRVTRVTPTGPPTNQADLLSTLPAPTISHRRRTPQGEIIDI